jgi:hypothetical protein
MSLEPLGMLVAVLMRRDHSRPSGQPGERDGRQVATMPDWPGLEACLWASVVFVLAAGGVSLLLPVRTQRDATRAQGRDPSAMALR